MGCFCGFLPLAIFSHKVSSPYEPEATGRLTPPNPPASEGVSIPYEPEATGRLCRSELCSRSSHIKFQAPTNRKPQADMKYGKLINELGDMDMFQFPTNGKAHSDSHKQGCLCYSPFSVSIPYEREGTFRQIVHFTQIFKYHHKSFNSLRTGRHIQTGLTINNVRGGIVFQFPTSGKAHSDMVGRLYVTPRNGFNSLRAGRHIQTKRKASSSENGSTVSIPYEREGTFRLSSHPKSTTTRSPSFNSLRAGRHIQTVNLIQRGD